MLDPAFEIIDPSFARLVFGNVHIETLWSGSRWAEGPAYFAAGKYLIWSDIPNDRLMRFDETDGSRRARAGGPLDQAREVPCLM